MFLKPYHKLLLICLGGLALRLIVSSFVQHPGIGDPNHYYNLAIFLKEGQGYNIDYIWQFNNPPDNLVHPDDYWMPLTGLLPAVSMAILGEGVQNALLPFVLMGSLIPLVAYAAARQFGCTEESALFTAAMGAVLPEFLLNSLRTDTTVPNILLVCGCILLLTRGLRTGHILPFIGAGFAAGLAYLVRSDSSLLLPMLIVMLFVYWLFQRERLHNRKIWAYLLLVPLIAVLLALPWSLRNIEVGGTFSTPRLTDMFFLADYREHFVYSSELNLQTLLANQTPAQLIAKRLFEMAASLKIMYTTLDVFLPVAVAGGMILVLAARDRRRLLILSPTLILLLGVFVFYTVLVPFKSQGGSFKKAYITIIPLLLPLAAYALERAITDQRIRRGVMLLGLLFTTANAVELIRADARFAATYMDAACALTDEALALPDTNGDDEIIVMTQDPFMLRFCGVRTVMIPMESRDVLLEVAQRYGVDYLLMPADRPSLDPLLTGAETDPRYVQAAISPFGQSFYSFDFDAIELAAEGAGS